MGSLPHGNMVLHCLPEGRWSCRQGRLAELARWHLGKGCRHVLGLWSGSGLSVTKIAAGCASVSNSVSEDDD